MAAVAVDVGTTMIKAVGYDDSGAETVVARRATTVHRSESDWAEQDMHDVWTAVAAVLRTVVEQLGRDVSYVALTAQGDGCWLVDARGEPTGPAILWNDGRASGIVDAWSRRGVLAQGFRVNGSLTFAGLPNAILSWLRRHDPDRLSRSATALTCGGWIFRRLTGETAIDQSDASAPFLDIRASTYAPELLELYDMPWAARLLPQVRGDGERVAALSTAAAARTGLPAGTPVVICPYDIVSTAIGVGAVSDGQACSILGTTLCTEVVTTKLDLAAEPAGLTVALTSDGRYLRAFPTLAGGEVIHWACGLLGVRDPAAFIDLARRGTPGARGLAFLPYLSPAGERAPFLDPLTRGTMLGLSFEHRREDVARAVLEGLTLVVADCLSASTADPAELRVCGGGAASGGWLQLIADVTGVPVLRSIDTQAGARGAFLVGAIATGSARSLEEVTARHVENQDTFFPAPDSAELYAELFAGFLAMRQILAPLGTRLAGLHQRATATAVMIGEDA